MPQPWTECVPRLAGRLTTLREVAASDVDTLLTLFSQPLVTAFMAPPPPTPAKFAGFVAWSHDERRNGRGLCFGVVPQGMEAAVGILQIRSLDPAMSSAEWGFVMGPQFWSSGIFVDAACALVDFAFSSLRVGRLEAHVATKNARAHAAIRKLGARSERTIPSEAPTGVTRDPEVLWALSADDWRNRPRETRPPDADERRQLQRSVEAAARVLRGGDLPKTIEPYPLFMFDRRRKR
ncbi:MAG TPA: GNAT family N-acetyltransferase [Vicinamibacterales bacterium]|nr:GNAT family N-acetyltransferase [Vicinamibacterales bacterium]